MNDDEKDAILEQAARAYAARHDETSRDSAGTRARVFASRAGDRRRTMIAMAAAAVLALGLGLPTAWAWSTGTLDAWLSGSDDARELVAPVTRSEDDQEAPTTTVSGVTEEDAVVAMPVAPVVPPAIDETREEPAVRSVEDDGPSIDPAERRTYRAAHALHFDTRDPTAALAAWDQYLEVYPSGRFAIEARYNRALCLVRLDRPEEARTALASFAEGRHGEYRRREATALIEALSE